MTTIEIITLALQVWTMLMLTAVFILTIWREGRR